MGSGANYASRREFHALRVRFTQKDLGRRCRYRWRLNGTGCAGFLSRCMCDPRQRFGVCLVVNHACNLRCTYCYTGTKFHKPMPWATGMTAIEHGFRSLLSGGLLELGFFGGEPLLESERIMQWMRAAKAMAQQSGKQINFNLTTNGTITGATARHIMLHPAVELAISFDGTPRMHDAHRRDAHGNATAARVEATLRWLIDAEKPFRVVVVVRPDNLLAVPDGLQYLHALGVQAVDLSLDLWTSWTAGDGVRLQKMVHRAAYLWRDWLPQFSLNWFDSKMAELAHLPAVHESTRCGFGAGEIAVAPSGRLYPCERVVGEDLPGHPLCLPGDVFNGMDFLAYQPKAFDRCKTCSGCALSPACDTNCRCSNFIRTGNTNLPDGLLCILNKATAEALARFLAPSDSSPEPQSQNVCNQKPCYV